ncbi:BOLA class I histocompatibility antigen, alpha chain BL3-7-like [Neoarius graeffei]|uniref:BOLA class I histocompatibility antigen, alpha chain BL3-7-like n=1 Tax=Neoarius graeffei TaxID=443677 RepID=UPI00298D0EB1|nr:BOLA class I histocompatibility antigen, alpha chain BL3-7-like [Neoarius graeffei]
MKLFIFVHFASFRGNIGTETWSPTVLEVLLFLLFSVHPSSAGSHTLQYQHTAVRGINSTEFTAVGLVDGEQFVFYDNNIKETIPKTDWIQKISADDPHYWKRETERMQNEDYRLTVTLGRIMECFNQTQGVHTVQRMYGCKLDDNTTRGYDLYGYDGEDFMGLDLETGTWTEAKPQAGIFLKEWDPTEAEAKYRKSYLENECIEWLKKFVSYGRETLERKVRPKVLVFHKHCPSPEVVCHATGFFPKALNITWQKDREDVIKDVEFNETLPNQDGSFQKRSTLKVPAEELQKHKYTCVVQHSSLEKDLILEVPKGRGQIGVIIGVLVALVAVVAAVVLWKKRNSGFKPVPPRPSSEGDSSFSNSISCCGGLPAEVRHSESETMLAIQSTASETFPLYPTSPDRPGSSANYGAVSSSPQSTGFQRGSSQGTEMAMAEG